MTPNQLKMMSLHQLLQLVRDIENVLYLRSLDERKRVAKQGHPDDDNVVISMDIDLYLSELDPMEFGDILYQPGTGDITMIK